jgi:hypothetical protein
MKIISPSFQLLAFGILGAFVLFPGCAHIDKSSPAADPAFLEKQACEPGTQVQSVRGSIALTVDTPELKGTYPAQVVTTNPDNLKMEITNPFGAKQALVTIEKGHYTVQTLDENTGDMRKKLEEGKDTYAGIPLEWAAQLFLGKIPCPSSANLKDSTLTTDSEGSLVVDTKPTSAGVSEHYVYKFRSWSGRPWPENLHWERRGEKGSNLAQNIDFKFSDPDFKTNSPKRWEARSSKGEVKVRWKDRETQSAP